VPRVKTVSMNADATVLRMGVWSPGAGLKGQAPNHPILLCLRGMVVSVGASLPRSGWGKGGLDPSGNRSQRLREVVEKVSASEPLMTR